MRKRSTLAFVWVPLLACGGDDGHHINTIDAKVFKDGPPAVCTASTTYGAVALGSGDQDMRSYKSVPITGGTSAPKEEVVGVLNADAAPDIMFMDLYVGYGAFAGSNNLKTGTFNITGDELNFATCGICPLIGTDFGSAGGEVDDYYAIDGSVTITSFGSAVGGSAGSGWAGTLAGSVSNMHFQHVTIAQDGSTTPVGDGCTSAVDSMAFSGTLSEQNFQNNGRAGYHLKLTHRRFR